MSRGLIHPHSAKNKNKKYKNNENFGKMTPKYPLIEDQATVCYILDSNFF
jgi:hypothetical protein